MESEWSSQTFAVSPSLSVCPWGAKSGKVDWLDEQLEERKAAHIKRVNAGRKGGKTTQNKQSSSNAKALRKDKIIKDKYANDNVLRVSDEVIKLLNKWF